jgi:hypothetical protein
MLVEMCVYHCLPGRLPVLLDRFRQTTLALFEKHGFKPLGFFTTKIGRSHQELTFMLGWDSLEERDRVWGTFMVDEDWLSARTASEQDGMIVDNASNQVLVPTDFSPMR